MYSKQAHKDFKKWKTFQSTLLANHTLIEVEDFGAGSKVFSSHRRKISKIVKHVGISPKRAHLLMKLMNYFNYTTVLEIGTSLGLGTCALALGNPKATITTLEGCSETANVAQKMFDLLELNNIQLVKGNFKETYLQSLKKHSYDCIYFDGNHSKEATIEYFHQCLPHIHNQSLLIFDDIHWSLGMKEAWQYIQNHPQVTVSIDTFQWGLVFFRKEQHKEHFIIRM